MTTTWISQQRLEDLAAEYHVASLLTAEGCLVRPVPETTESGIALHCERASKGSASASPLLHFWVHVRCGETVRVHDGGAQASGLFRVEDLAYWKRQPVPVLAVLIASREPTRPEAMYFVHLSDHLANARLPEDKDRVAIRSDGRLDPNSLDSMRRFFARVSSGSQKTPDAAESSAGPSPTLVDAYCRESVAGEEGRHWWQICEDVRHTSAMALPELIYALPQCGQGAGTEFLELLCARVAPIVRLYADVGDQHWETHYALGVHAMANGNVNEGAAYLERAESYLTLDDAFKRDYPHWPQVIEDIRRRKDSCLAALAGKG